MTQAQHNPKDVEALIDAAKRASDHFNRTGIVSLETELNAALAKLESKPEKPREWWLNVYSDGGSYYYDHPDDAAYGLRVNGETVHVRELTATDAPVQKWNMPEWGELLLTSDNRFKFEYEYARYTIANDWYEGLRNKIMGLS